MRYDMTHFFEDPKGVCWWKRSGPKNTSGSLYGQDPRGSIFCRSPRGTGVNAEGREHNKAGAASRGACMSQLCLKNGAH